MSIPGRLRLCRGLSSRSSSVSQCEWLGAPSWPSALVEGHWSPLVSWGIPTFFFYGICGILDGSMISKVKNDWELVGQFWSKKLWALTRAPTICILPTVLLYFSDLFCVVSRWCPAVLWFLVPKLSWRVSIPGADQQQFSGARNLTHHTDSYCTADGQLLGKLDGFLKAGGVYEWLIMICLWQSQNGWTQLLRIDYRA